MVNYSYVRRVQPPAADGRGTVRRTPHGTGAGMEHMTLTDVDLEFLAEASVPDVKDRGRLKALLREDEDFRNAFLEDERTFRKVVLDREIFLRISPPLYFEILLRRARWELAGLSHTIERDALRKVAVFDAKEVAAPADVAKAPPSAITIATASIRVAIRP